MSSAPTEDRSKAQIYRWKAAMVLYEIERSLGTMVLDQSSSTPISESAEDLVTQIRDRAAEAGRVIDPSHTLAVVEETYLDEVFRLAEALGKGRREEEQLKSLRELFQALGIFNVRNAISHPNRPFPPHYWYRVATVACDPAVLQLPLPTVTQALSSAEAGQLNLPPDEWLNASAWNMPNNLPARFDHDVTGLVGRSKELKSLRKTLANRRLNLVALVGRGGAGKTAIALDLLLGIVSGPESRDLFAHVVYVSAKTEILTSDGVQQIASAPATIEGVQAEIALALGASPPTFDRAKEVRGRDPVLLCIDNLETLLRDVPEAFEAFYNELPTTWRVLVTSRVQVNSATTVSIPDLDSQGAKALAREYLAKRGGQRLPEAELESLVTTCDCNPLAIRLSVDALLAGVELHEALSRTQQAVREFSYKTLVDALSPDARALLECLFVCDGPVSRSLAISLLGFDSDQIAGAFAEVRSTALVSRDLGSSQEQFRLSSSVRDLLLSHPADPEARGRVHEALRRQRLIVHEQRRQGAEAQSVGQWRYVPPEVPEHIQSLVTEVCRTAFQAGVMSSELSQLLARVQRAASGSAADRGVLKRMEGLLLLKLGDRARAKECLKAGAQQTPPDLACVLHLANEYRADQQLQEAIEMAKVAVDLGYADPSFPDGDPVLAGEVEAAYSLPLLWNGRTEEVLSRTENWTASQYDDHRLVLGLLFAQALRNRGEYSYDRDAPDGGGVEVSANLVRASEVLDEVFAQFGYPGRAVDEGMKLVLQFGYALHPRVNLPSEAPIAFVRFAARHLPQLLQEHRSCTIDSPKVQQLVDRLREVEVQAGEENPFTLPPWAAEQDMETDDDCSWLQVRVYYRPSPFEDGRERNYLFVHDDTGRQYHLRRGVLPRHSYSEWASLAVGDPLAVIPETAHEEGRATPIQRARFGGQ